MSPSDNEMTAEEQWQHMWELQQLPRTPGTAGGLKSPMTPRTRAFQSLGGEGTYASTQQHPPMPTSPYQYPEPLGITTTTTAPSPYQHYQQAVAAESPYQSNAEYYGQLETEWRGKGNAY